MQKNRDDYCDELLLNINNLQVRKENMERVVLESGMTIIPSLVVHLVEPCKISGLVLIPEALVFLSCLLLSKRSAKLMCGERTKYNLVNDFMSVRKVFDGDDICKDIDRAIDTCINEHPPLKLKKKN